MRSGYRRALLARMASSGVGTHRICLLFCKEIPVVPRRFSQVYLHLLCLLFSVSRVSKRHFPNGNRRQPPPCLPKSETDGRCQWRRSRPFFSARSFRRSVLPSAAPFVWPRGKSPGAGFFRPARRAARRAFCAAAPFPPRVHSSFQFEPAVKFAPSHSFPLSMAAKVWYDGLTGRDGRMARPAGERA